MTIQDMKFGNSIIDWLILTNSFLRSSFRISEIASAVSVPKMIKSKFRYMVLKVTVNALFDRKKNSKFFKPIHSLWNIPLL
ncbi:hypothetical protein D3C87_1666010 [compost metagenome]